MLYHRFGFVSFATVKICQRTLHKLKMTRFVCMNIVKLIWETKAKLFCVNLMILKMIGLNILIPKSLTSSYTLTHCMIWLKIKVTLLALDVKWDTVCWIVFFTSFLSSSSVSGTCRKQYWNMQICVHIYKPSCQAWRVPAAEWVHLSCCTPGKCRRQEGPRQLQWNLMKVVFIRQQWNWKMGTYFQNNV